MAVDPGQQERVTLSDEEDLAIVIPKLQLPDVTRIEEHQQPSSIVSRLFCEHDRC